MNIAIIKYNSGNVISVKNALSRLGVNSVVTDNEQLIKSADKVIFPGVGEASTAMKYLRSRKLDECIKNLTQPVLGICLGMQLLCSHSDENNTTCLGIFDINVKHFIGELNIPHVGWNTIKCSNNPLFKGVENGMYLYFVHSYYIPVNKYTISHCNYIHDFSASINKGNFYGTQFHPEKSGSIGEQILRNFIELR